MWREFLDYWGIATLILFADRPEDLELEARMEEQQEREKAREEERQMALETPENLGEDLRKRCAV